MDTVSLINDGASAENGAPAEDGAPSLDVSNPRLDGLKAFHRRRKQASLDGLLAAASELFCERGYSAVGVDDIAALAGVSRMTFYRHFDSKADLAAGLFDVTTAAARPMFLAIGSEDFRDRAVVKEWIGTLFATDRANGRLLQVFTQAAIDEGFARRAHGFIGNLISSLGALIPAFSADPDPGNAADRRRWLEAWLLLYEILDQSNHAALASGIATDPLVIEILTDRFLGFVTGQL